LEAPDSRRQGLRWSIASSASSVIGKLIAQATTVAKGSTSMKIRPLHILGGVGLGALLFSIACGGGSSSGTSGTPASTTGTVHVVVSDDATEDWATIGVKVLGVSLVPQGGGSPVTVYTAPSTPPVINLVQLDQLGEIIGNATIPTGTYTRARTTTARPAMYLWSSPEIRRAASTFPQERWCRAARSLSPAHKGVRQT